MSSETNNILRESEKRLYKLKSQGKDFFRYDWEKGFWVYYPDIKWIGGKRVFRT